MSEDQILRIEKSLDEIKGILVGTVDDEGLVHVVKYDHEWILRQKKKKSNYFNAVIQNVIRLVVLYIAVKVGLG